MKASLLFVTILVILNSCVDKTEQGKLYSLYFKFIFSSKNTPSLIFCGFQKGSQNENLKKEIQYLKSEKASLLSENQRLYQENADLIHHLEVHKSQLESLHASIIVQHEEHNKTVESLEKTELLWLGLIQNLLNEGELARQKYTDTHSMAEAMRLHWIEEREKLTQENRMETATLKQKIAILEHNLTVCTQQREDLLNGRCADGLVDILNTKNADLSHKLSESEGKIAFLEAQLSNRANDQQAQVQSQQTIEKLIADNHNCEMLRAALVKQVDEMSSELVSLQKAKHAFETLKSHVLSVEEQKNLLESANNQMRSEIAGLLKYKMDFVELKNKSILLEGVKNTLERENNRMMSVIQGLERRNVDDLEVCKQKMIALEKQKNSFESENNQIKSALAGFQNDKRDLLALRNKMIILENEKNSLQNTNKQVRSELTHLQTLKSDCAALNNKLILLEAEKNLLASENNKIKFELAGLEGNKRDLEALKNKLIALEKQKNSFESENNQIRSDLANMREQLKEKDNKIQHLRMAHTSLPCTTTTTTTSKTTSSVETTPISVKMPLVIVETTTLSVETTSNIVETTEPPVVRQLTSLDETVFFIPTNDFSVQVLDSTSKQVLKTFTGHKSNIVAIERLTDTKLVSGSTDGEIRIWSLDDNNNQLMSNGSTVAHERLTTLHVLSASKLASAGGDGKLMIWNLDDGKCEATLVHSPGYQPTSQELFFKTKRAIPSKPVNTLALLSDNRLASGSNDSTIKIWNLDDSTCLAVLKGHSAAILALQVLSETILASASADTSVKIWNLASNQCVQTLVGHTNQVVALRAISGSELASASLDNTIKLWNWSDATCVRTITDLTIQQMPEGFAQNALEFLKI